MSGKVIQPSEEHECSSCGIDNVLLHVTEIPFTQLVNNRRSRDEPYLFCDFCFETFAGNACQYPDQYRDEDRGEVMRHICAVANILLRKLQESGKDRGRKHIVD